tara:strand:+ start:595 stop:1650 length:1056 start_codon:yes stop_codon:yes gene_type:complete
MAYAAISKPSLHFNTKLYTGTGSTQNITGVEFQPDLVWIKKRNNADDHSLVDAVRGVTKYLQSNSNVTEQTYAGNVSAFGTDGFTVGDGNNVNQNTHTFASWNWKAGGSTSSNSDGSVTSTVSVNSTAGFSISKYTGTGSNLTFGHGLGAIPDWFMIKNLTVNQAWRVYHQKMTVSDPYSKRMVLSETGSDNSSALGLSADPTASLIQIDNSTGCTNANNENFICYAWVEKKGFSKFGSYTGNGNSDGQFVYTGFKPAWIMVKVTNDADNWHMIDDKRDSFNTMDSHLYANLNNAEYTSSSYNFDMLSNGFKPRSTNNAFNASGKPYIYMAFAAEPLVANVGTNGIPATAR